MTGYNEKIVGDLQEKLTERIVQKLNDDDVEFDVGVYPCMGTFEGKEYKVQTLKCIFKDIFDEFIVDEFSGKLIDPVEFEPIYCNLPIYDFPGTFLDKFTDKIYNVLYKDIPNPVHFRVFNDIIVAFPTVEYGKVVENDKYIPKIHVGVRTRYLCFNNEQGVGEWDSGETYNSL